GEGQYTYNDHVFEGVLASDGSANSIGVPLDAQWYLGNGGGFGSVDEHFVEDASFYRLRFVSLGYDLGSQIKGIDRLKLTFTGRNLLLFTPYTGFDPESSLVGSSSNGQGLEYFQMPGTKSYAFGVQLTF
ncbi:MAG: SusC/RagA family TonB-linked outer membrane protein, partial [Bacteroidota bacterium]